jgi:Sel1 repeat
MRRTRSMTVLGLVLVGSVGVWLVETQRPITDDPFIAAMTRGDYPTALRLVRPLADQGDAIAQNNLGVMYDRGKCVPQDYAEAVKWDRLAANQGYDRAQTNLGILYADGGHGVPQDYAEAVKWDRRTINDALDTFTWVAGFQTMYWRHCRKPRARRSTP